MKKRTKFILTFITLISLTALFLFITSSITKHTGYSISEQDSENEFEKCLNQQYIELYINTADTTKTLQNIKLNKYLNYVKIINCEKNNQYCLNEKIDSFPTWIINEYKVEKDITFSELISYSKCKL